MIIKVLLGTYMYKGQRERTGEGVECRTGPGGHRFVALKVTNPQLGNDKELIDSVHSIFFKKKKKKKKKNFVTVFA